MMGEHREVEVVVVNVEKAREPKTVVAGVLQAQVSMVVAEMQQSAEGRVGRVGVTDRASRAMPCSTALLNGCAEACRCEMSG